MSGIIRHWGITFAPFRLCTHQGGATLRGDLCSAIIFLLLMLMVSKEGGGALLFLSWRLFNLGIKAFSKSELISEGGKFLKYCDLGSGNLAHQYWWLFPKTRYPCLSCFLRHDSALASSLSILQIFVTSHNSDPINNTHTQFVETSDYKYFMFHHSDPINNAHTICRNFILRMLMRNSQHTICGKSINIVNI